jgi:hypothetical protein
MRLSTTRSYQIWNFGCSHIAIIQLPKWSSGCKQQLQVSASFPAYPVCHLVVLIVAAQNKTRWSALKQIQFICASARLQLQTKIDSKRIKKTSHTSWILACTENTSPELHNSNTNMAWWCHSSTCQKEDLYRLSTKQNMQYIIHIRSFGDACSELHWQLWHIARV